MAVETVCGALADNVGPRGILCIDDAGGARNSQCPVLPALVILGPRLPVYRRAISQSIYG